MKDTLLKALVRNQLSPGRTLFGCVFAVAVAFLVYHRLNQGNFWIGYGIWEASSFASFWITRAYKWAGGK